MIWNRGGLTPSFFSFGGDDMKILAIDQARHGACSVFDYENKKLLDYGVWNFDSRKFTYESTIMNIEALLEELIEKHEVDAVFLEDISMRKNNAQVVKRLAQLQGVLVNYCMKREFLYWIVVPSQWQNYCNARGRTTKEIKLNVKKADGDTEKASKILSLQFVKEKFGIDTEDDNLSDAICIGYYAVNEIKIHKGESK